MIDRDPVAGRLVGDIPEADPRSTLKAAVVLPPRSPVVIPTLTVCRLTLEEGEQRMDEADTHWVAWGGVLPRRAREDKSATEASKDPARVILALLVAAALLFLLDDTMLAR